MKNGFVMIGLVLSAVVLQAQKNIFLEDFKTNKAKWSLFSNITKDSATAVVTNGQLVLDNKQLGFAVSLNSITNKKININTDEEVIVNASFTHVAGQKLAGYGMLLGEKLPGDKYNGYCFLIVDTGYYRMYISKDGKQIKYVDWIANKAIKTGNATNVLTMVKKRNQFHFLINGQWLFDIENAKININSIGLVATDKQKIALDNIKIESFAKETDKKEADKINDLLTILEQNNTWFAKASRANVNFPTTWLPYLQAANQNVNILMGSAKPYYRDNCSYEKPQFDVNVKLYTGYIEKALVKFEKIEKTTVLGKVTYWINKNEKFAKGVYIKLKEFSISGTYFIEIEIRNEPDVTKERLEEKDDN
ncbi:MAG: hypothetical protein WBC06_12325 [Chitinophagaceae bacterium]